MGARVPRELSKDNLAKVQTLGRPVARRLGQMQKRQNGALKRDQLLTQPRSNPERERELQIIQRLDEWELAVKENSKDLSLNSSQERAGN